MHLLKVFFGKKRTKEEAKSLFLEKPTKKRSLKFPIQIHKRVIRALETIQENPFIGVKLHEELNDYYKYRLGDYRIVYSFNSKESIVIVIKVEYRQGVYK